MFLLFLLSWPPICQVCLNFEVVLFQSYTGTPPDLVSVANCFAAICSYYQSSLFYLLPDIRSGGLPAHASSLPPLPTAVSSHRIIRPPRYHMSLSHNTKDRRSLHQNPLPPCLPHPLHACRILNTAPLLPIRRFPSSHLSAPPPYLLSCIPVINLK